MGRKRSRKFWEARAMDEPGVGELLLYGEIGDYTWWGDEVTPRQFKEDLDALGDISELRVFINSPGGDVFAGQAIYSILRRHKAKVSVYVDGIAASAASLIAMAGDRIVMPHNAMLMIHNPWTLAAGDANHFLEVAEALDKVRDAMIAVYEEQTGLGKDEIVALLDAETWMTAAEAIELGFADGIEEAKQVAASVAGKGKLLINGLVVDLTQYQNPPKVLVAKQEQEPPPDNRLRLLSVELELLTGSNLRRNEND